MKLSLMKIIGKYMIFIILIIGTIGLISACRSDSDDSTMKFFNSVKESQEYLDTYADDIYRCWYDAIYNDKYGGSIDIAIYYAELSNSDNIEAIKANDELIKSYYKEAKDGKYAEYIKEVMKAYGDYYEFVMNVSGSFNTYSKDKEIKKKALASAIRNLEYELY